MDLQLCTSTTMTARLPKMRIISIILASLANCQALFLNFTICSFDKGKPVERRGRKAMDLQLRTSVIMTARLPKASEDLRLVIFECLYREGKSKWHSKIK